MINSIKEGKMEATVNGYALVGKPASFAVNISNKSGNAHFTIL